METSLFIQFVQRLFPVLKTLIEKVNGRREGQNELTYLHKDTNILRRVYSADNKWEADTVDTSYVAADYVAEDSPLPLKSRGAIEAATGKLPKVGMKKLKKESFINKLNIMQAQGGNDEEISRIFASDAVACSVGIDERTEYAFLSGLCNGYVAIKDEEKEGALLRLNYRYLDKNKYGIIDGNEGLTIDDLYNIIERASEDGNTITTFWISKKRFTQLKASEGARELVATYRGLVYTGETVLPVPTSDAFQQAFEDETGVNFQIVNRSIRIEKNGTYTSTKPWDDNRVIGVCNTQIGALVYGRLAEQTNPVNSVTYSLVDTYKLISEYSTNDPLVEITSGQAYVCPVIENPDQIYVVNCSDYQQVDDDKEGEDTDDVKITVWNTTYDKSGFVEELNKIDGGNLTVKSRDTTVIAHVNKLSDEEEALLKEAVEQYNN